MKTKISERTSFVLDESNIDRKSKVLRNVSILGKVSKNNRVYSDAALDDVVHLLTENGRCYLDHQPRAQEGDGRRVRELLGKYVKPRREGETIFADLIVLEHLSGWMFDVAERMPDVMGSSIDGEAMIEPGGAEEDKDLVERVLRLNSTDMVSFPATTKSLFEETETGANAEEDPDKKKESKMMEQLLRLLAALGTDTSALQNASEEDLRKAVDAAVAVVETRKTQETEIGTLKQENETLKTQVSELTQKVTDLETELDKYHAEENERKAREEATKLINDAGIPSRLVSETFVKQLMKAENDEEKKSLIDERKEIAEGIREDVDLGRSREEREAANKSTVLTDEELIARHREASRSH